VPHYPGPAFRLEIRDQGGFSAFCEGTTDSYPFLHVTPGSFVAWTLEPTATVPFVVVTFPMSPIDDDVSVFVIYRGQWTWARIRESIKVDPEATCGDGSNTVYSYTISTLGAAMQLGPGVIVCPPGNPTCQ
jgi:hypothetical protein